MGDPIFFGIPLILFGKIKMHFSNSSSNDKNSPTECDTTLH